MEDVPVAEVSPDDVDLAGVFLLLGGVAGQLREGDLLDALDGLWEGVVVVIDDCRKEGGWESRRQSLSRPGPSARGLQREKDDKDNSPVTLYLLVRRQARTTWLPM